MVVIGRVGSPGLNNSKNILFSLIFLISYDPFSNFLVCLKYKGERENSFNLITSEPITILFQLFFQSYFRCLVDLF